MLKLEKNLTSVILHSQLVYGNFEFLNSYVKAFSVQLMVEEITATLKAMPEEHHLRLQLELLRDTLR